MSGFLLSFFFFFSSRRRHTRSLRDWSSDVCSSDLQVHAQLVAQPQESLSPWHGDGRVACGVAQQRFDALQAELGIDDERAWFAVQEIAGGIYLEKQHVGITGRTARRARSAPPVGRLPPQLDTDFVQ